MSPASGEDAGPELDGLGGENAAAAGHGPGSWRIRSSLQLGTMPRERSGRPASRARGSGSDRLERVALPVVLAVERAMSEHLRSGP